MGGFNVVTEYLDELFDALDAPPPPRMRRTYSEFLHALDAGDISGFFLDDFEEPMRGRVARRFGLTFEDGAGYNHTDET
jgi:hypothetical protein